MKNVLWYLGKWLLGTPIMMMGGLIVVATGTILIAWGIVIMLVAPFVSPFSNITLKELGIEDEDSEVVVQSQIFTELD